MINDVILSFDKRGDARSWNEIKDSLKGDTNPRKVISSLRRLSIPSNDIEGFCISVVPSRGDKKYQNPKDFSEGEELTGRRSTQRGTRSL